LSNDSYWLAKTSGGWTVEDRCQIFALHSTRGAALAHRDRLIAQNGALFEPLDAHTVHLPDMPKSDAFVRRFS
jgi:hypothetical protein